ncbi:MAG TPA: hypothetical protein VF456_15425 [Vicinamibacterales bacterium]
MKRLPIVSAAALAAALIAKTGVGAGQLTYSRGQNVVAAFDGWERHADGTFGMVFSYYNRNYEELIDVPIGTENNIEPGGPDQGQPTHFLPARHKFVFSVTVPKDWDPKKRLVWTLIVRGKTEKANGFLLPEWEINNQVRAQNGNSSHPVTVGNAADYNEAPVITPGPAQRITLPATATLTAAVKDDGLPKRAGGRAAATRSTTLQNQLFVNWVMYRGPVGATVKFESDSSPVEDGKASTTATFSRPGEYVIRAYADDGAVTTPADISVSVLPAK